MGDGGDGGGYGGDGGFGDGYGGFGFGDSDGFGFAAPADSSPAVGFNTESQQDVSITDTVMSFMAQTNQSITVAAAQVAQAMNSPFATVADAQVDAPAKDFSFKSVALAAVLGKGLAAISPALAAFNAMAGNPIGNFASGLTSTPADSSPYAADGAIAPAPDGWGIGAGGERFYTPQILPGVQILPTTTITTAPVATVATAAPVATVTSAANGLDSLLTGLLGALLGTTANSGATALQSAQDSTLSTSASQPGVDKNLLVILGLGGLLMVTT